MKKAKLNLNEIKIESFITKVSNDKRFTIVGGNLGNSKATVLPLESVCQYCNMPTLDIHNPDCDGYETGKSYHLADCAKEIKALSLQTCGNHT